MDEFEQGAEVSVQLKCKSNWVPGTVKEKISTYLMKANDGLEYIQNVFFYKIRSTRLVGNIPNRKIEVERRIDKCFIPLDNQLDTSDSGYEIVEQHNSP